MESDKHWKSGWVSSAKETPSMTGFYWVDFDDHHHMIGWFERGVWTFAGLETDYPHTGSHPSRFYPEALIPPFVGAN